MKLSEMNYDARKELAELLEAWLTMYTEEVINHVMNNHLDEIIENESSMMLLRELKKRQDEEKKDHIRNFDSYLWQIEKKTKVDASYYHSSVLTHSGSYRHVLYDLYIQDMHGRSE